MTQTEIVKILRRMKRTWGNFQIPDDEEELEEMLEIWTDWVGDYSYEAVCAVMKEFRGNHWAPGPAEILGQLSPLSEPADGGVGEPWMARNKPEGFFAKYGDGRPPGGWTPNPPPRPVPSLPIPGTHTHEGECPPRMHCPKCGAQNKLACCSG